MAGIIEKRRSVYRDLIETQHKTENLESQMAQLQALANIGTVTCMIAHEMNNILTPLANYAQLALNNPEDKALSKKALEKTAVNASRAGKVLDSMLAMANGEKQQKMQCRVKLMLDDVFGCICRDFAKDRIKVEINVPGDMTISAIPIQMQQVFMNLILNARHAMLGKSGYLKISAQEEADLCVLQFADSGHGMTSDIMEKIFDPFFTTKAGSENTPRAGAGLGLALCKQIIETHGGQITVDSIPNQGTIFKIILPRTLPG